MKARPSLPSLVDTYLCERAARHEFSPQTLRNVQCALRNFAAVMGDRPVAKIARADVEEWLGTRHRMAAATRRHNLSSVRAFCQWLTRRGYLPVDPTAELPPVRVPRYLPRAIGAPKVGKLLEYVPDARGRLIVLLEVQEGLRCLEVSGLQLGDIDFEGRTVRIIGKGGHQRMLPVSGETWEALTAYLAEHPATSGPLVRSYRQEWHSLTPDTISGMVSEWMSRAGIKRWPRDGVSAHALRHQMATDALRSGAHLRDVQAALGHAHLSTTEVYLPLVVNDLRSAMGGRRYRGAGVDGSSPQR